MDDFKAHLRGKGLRATPGRVALLSLLRHAGQPLSVGEILERSSKPLLDQVSLYRALESLADVGLLRRGVGSVMRYEYARSPHHHHLVCVDCGFTRMCANC
jgi:Fur family transcriptional regulator, ferric uptake regulator